MVTALLAVALQAQTPFFAKHCVACHATMPDPAKVREKLVAGKMPPPGRPLPSKEEVATFLASLTQPDAMPRVTTRRLNRTEYNNTVRDLLGVYARPADEFPVDDSGYGFDNIGDVLTVSPMLMEKYVAAAKKLSRLAVYGETLPAQPGVLTRLMARRSYDGGAMAGSSYLPYSMRGALYGTYVFPADGEYELRFRAMNLTPDSDRTAGTLALQLAVDGQVVLTGAIVGTTSVGYDRGEFIARVPLTAGPHDLRASFPELAEMADPRKHLNPDLRRKIFVDYLDIAGPFRRKPHRSPIFVCSTKDDACAAQIITALARRAFRRPPEPREVDNLVRLAARVRSNGDSFEESIRVAVQAVLISPQFLFRLESHPLTNADLASRLSYFLWASMPDEELLRADLANRAVVAQQVRRMLADAKSRSLVDDFGEQWLQLRELDRRRPAPERFPALDDELLDGMRRETHLFFETVIREDRSILDFLDARFTFVNGPLARHYGIPGVQGEAFQRVTLDGDQRSGLLTQGAILTVSSYPTRTSPVIRGKWVLENLLGTPPPPPPPDIPDLEEARIGISASLRKQLEMHRDKPSCAVCHDQMDALGFALENYDAAGAWRTHEGQFEIDSSGTLPGGRAIRGSRELKQVLRERSGQFTRNLSEKLLTYALGRGLEAYDGAVVDDIVRQVKAGDHRFSTLVLAIVTSQPFRGATP